MVQVKQNESTKLQLLIIEEISRKERKLSWVEVEIRKHGYNQNASYRNGIVKEENYKSSRQELRKFGMFYLACALSFPVGGF